MISSTGDKLVIKSNIEIKFEINEGTKEMLRNVHSGKLIDWDMSGKIKIMINNKSLFKVSPVANNVLSVTNDLEIIEDVVIFEWFAALLDTTMKLMGSTNVVTLNFEESIFSITCKKEDEKIYITSTTQKIEPEVELRWGVRYSGNLINEPVLLNDFIDEVLRGSEEFYNEIIRLAPHLKEHESIKGFKIHGLDCVRKQYEQRFREG